MTNTRVFSLASLLTLGLAIAAGAQSIATFGSAEAAGFGEGSALLGSSINTGHQGWGPVGTITAQTYRYRSGANTHAQAYALSPSVGLINIMRGGSIQGGVGYTFVHADGPVNVLGVEGGSKNGVFVSAQGNYWGNGENSAQVIGSYGFASDYYWTRGRASHRLAPSATPVYLGAEVVVQGSQKFVPAATRYQFGPTLEYRFTPQFRMGMSGGYRGGNNNAAGTGYGRVEFLVLTTM